MSPISYIFASFINKSNTLVEPPAHGQMSYYMLHFATRFWTIACIKLG
jgi:hypothetical protein